MYKKKLLGAFMYSGLLPNIFPVDLDGKTHQKTQYRLDVSLCVAFYLKVTNVCNPSKGKKLGKRKENICFTREGNMTTLTQV